MLDSNMITKADALVKKGCHAADPLGFVMGAPGGQDATSASSPTW